MTARPVLVFAPTPLLTVTIEDRSGESDRYIHADGHGWTRHVVRLT